MSIIDDFFGKDFMSLLNGSDGFLFTNYQQHSSDAQFSYDKKTGTLEIEMPGVKREQIDLKLLNDQRTLIVSWKDRRDDDKQVIHGWSGPIEVKRAKLADGVLTLILEGKKEEDEGRKIPVE